MGGIKGIGDMDGIDDIDDMDDMDDMDDIDVVPAGDPATHGEEMHLPDGVVVAREIEHTVGLAGSIEEEMLLEAAELEDIEGI